MFTSFNRVLKFALADFYRNKGISIAAIFILFVTISLVTALFFMHGITDTIISQIENKIDITAYFKETASEADILNAKDAILKSSDHIKSVEYVSKEQALNNFTQTHKDNPVFSNALNQVGDNPFLPSLNIITKPDALQYQEIAIVLEGDQFADLIDSVDYSQKENTIKKVFSITSGINRFGWGLAIILVLLAVLVVFNTIKLAINNSKEEINTMVVVGASSWFVRAPFIIQGALFGLISFAICFIATILICYFLSSGLAIIVPGFSLWNYCLSHIFIVILIQLSFGVGLGGLISFIVVQKYLKV